jgi:hypothetical protein
MVKIVRLIMAGMCYGPVSACMERVTVKNVGLRMDKQEGAPSVPSVVI